MSLTHGILGFLSYSSMTGYDLSKAFHSSVQFFWYAQASHIYLELTKLEKKKWVTCEMVMQTEKPNKKLYTITDAGKAEFLNWLADENKDMKKGMKNAFLMKVFFASNKTKSQSIAMLRSFSNDCQNYLCDMQSIPQSIAQYSEFADPYQVLCWHLTSDFGDRYMKMCIAWADDAIQKLEELQ